MNKDKVFIIIYSLILITELVSTTFTLPKILHFIAKPLLIISLIYYLLTTNYSNIQTKKFVLLALFFSIIGDILLMFVYLKNTLFIFGLIAFLIAHIMYVVVFAKERNKTQKLFPVLGFLVIYGVAFFIFISSSLGNLIVPVSIYMVVILMMVLFATLRKGNVNAKSYVLVLAGALLFVVSDSILAINKFHTPIPFPNLWIMTTYAIAQFLIVFGITKNN